MKFDLGGRGSNTIKDLVEKRVSTLGWPRVYIDEGEIASRGVHERNYR